MPVEPGDIYQPANAAELKNMMLTDARLAVLDRDPSAAVPDQPGGEWDITFGSVANAQMLLHANVSIHDRNSDPRRAAEPKLDDHRQAAGLPVVQASPSVGQFIVGVAGGGSTVVPDQLVALLPGNVLAYASGQQKVADGGPVNVVTQVGADTEFAGGVVATWQSPPGNLEGEATVSPASPLQGGSDLETPERKRLRIANAKRFPIIPIGTGGSGGSPGYMREMAFRALGSVQNVFIYPALGGPATSKIVIVKAFSRATFDFSREMAEAGLQIVRQSIQRLFGVDAQRVVQRANDTVTDVALLLGLPSPPNNPDPGWVNVDAARWPILSGGDTRVEISLLAPSAGYDIRVNASTTTAPVAGQTMIGWYARAAQKFYVRRIVGVTGGTGAWDLALDTPLVDESGTSAAVGDYISPAASQMERYGRTWLAQVEVLGPAENTSDANRLPRSLRLPLQTEEWPASLNDRQLTALASAHGEIASAAYSYRLLSTPVVAGSVDNTPNILAPRNFAIYPA